MLNIICLHGYGSTAATLRKIMSEHVEKLETIYNLIFLDGPHKVGENNCWWYYDEKIDDKSIDNNDATRINWTTITKEKPVGLAESIEYLRKYVENDKTIAIIGFSQGAAFANILAHQFYIPKVILCSGFLIDNSNIKHLNINSEITTQSLHIFGESDEIISQQLSKELLNIYTDSQIVCHEKGHIFPSNAMIRNKILNFLDIQEAKK